MPLPQYITRTLCDKELLRVNNNGQGPFLVEVCLRRYAEDGNDIWAKVRLERFIMVLWS